MDLNTRGRYAVMAMADLALRAEGAPVALSAIAERQNLSIDYLEQLFTKLRRAGLVESLRGRNGGYQLHRAASAINVSEIMAAVEEGTRMTRCAGEASAGCTRGERCLTHGLWEALGEEIDGFLSRVTLADVIEGIPDSKRTSHAGVSALFGPLATAATRA